ncbi:phosphohistidine phosphatase SixA [Morganella morganii]|uniref:phosphohistidine phosphatase SixA n=1 Tax=Morganella morganii TaxID=582 RepID=UPI00069B61E2|nr:phosphohistidine phosphatase SixA [Morganella morganii]KNZ87211.1 phosphohistidine phosphatase [Morganella morganii]MBS9540564.1 phosphohistidine phosphatase SixA [Morganella morganii subsp. morganii]MDF2405564.1 phosphohistidine phosphatase SixA [Morganella morganii]HCR4033283.1 phosphohistidine phosphatase SixA [Morganella morganii]
MQVFIMRHGDAALQAASDSVRPLTGKGINDSRNMAKWLAGQDILTDTVLVSPYLRAEQTLTEIRDDLNLPAQEEVMPGLTPSGNAESVADYIRYLAEEGRKGVLVVSHLPLVGYLVAALCPQETAPMFATSSVACIELDNNGRGTLLWHRGPGQTD